MFTTILFLILGLAVLVGGAELLIRGASSLAKRLGVSSLIIGLTVVAIGTSAPELFVNIFASIRGHVDIGLGNILGSNITNILLVLGLSATLVPIAVHHSVVRREIPFALLAMIFLLIVSNDLFLRGTPSYIDRVDGVVFITLFAVFIYYLATVRKKFFERPLDGVQVYSLSLTWGYILAGGVLLYLGGNLLVDHAVILAKSAGVSDALIGLTIIAIGTSLPELTTSLLALRHHHDDMAIGNIVGSNILNIFLILGITSIINPIAFNTMLNVDILIGIVATLLLIAAVFTGKRNTIDKWQGVLFIMLYVLYIGYLIQRG